MVDFTKMQMDAFQEVGNIGAGRAATSLSKMLGKRIDIKVPESKLMPIASFAGCLGGPEKIVQGVHVEVRGGLQGRTVLLFSNEASRKLVLSITGAPAPEGELTGDDLSAFTEFANIFVGNFLNGISDLLDIKLLPGIPEAAHDMAQALIDMVLAELSMNADNLLFVRSNFIVENKEIEGSLVLFLDEVSLNKILERLNEKYSLKI